MSKPTTDVAGENRPVMTVITPRALQAKLRKHNRRLPASSGDDPLRAQLKREERELKHKFGEDE